jgi:hypothetical protein
MGSKNVLKFLFNENIANKSVTTEATEKNKHRFGVGRIFEFFKIFV